MYSAIVIEALIYTYTAYTVFTMPQTNNLRIASFEDIETPEEVMSKVPLTKEAEATVLKGREGLQKILDHQDARKIVIVGPCSIHDYDQAIEYAKNLNELRKKVEDKLLLIMRVYLEKPRTTVGWKGFIYDPFLDDSYSLDHGVELSRKLLVEINEMGLPTATEVLNPISIQYISDLTCWGAIGARTAESQTHRELSSGLSMPVGFKNGTEGGVDISINAILAARAPHSFLGMDDRGLVKIVRTTGNAYGHIILRGGNSGPNFSAEHVAATEEACKVAGIDPRIIIDCSHANSDKDHRNQHKVWHSVWEQIKNGSDSIVGLMLESNTKPGNQKITGSPEDLEPGVSVTDACIGFEETEKLVLSSL